MWRRGFPVLAGLVAACRGGGEPPTVAYAYGQTGAPVVQVAREALARDERLRGVRIVYDSGSASVAAHVEVARAEAMLAVPSLAGVVGHYGSRGSLVAAPLYNRAGVPQLVPTGTSRILGQVGPWTFTLAPNELVEGGFIARFIADSLRARTVSLLYLNNEYGRGMREVVIGRLAERGVRALDEVSFDRLSRFDVLVAASLARGVPDAMVLIGEPTESAVILREAAARVPGLRFVLADGSFDPVLFATAAPAARDSVYGVQFWRPDTTLASHRDFVARFQQAAGRMPQHLAALGYDALLLLATATSEVGGDPAAVRRYLESLGRTRPPYQGLTGAVTFLADRRAPLYMMRARDRSVVFSEGS